MKLNTAAHVFGMSILHDVRKKICLPDPKLNLGSYSTANNKEVKALLRNSGGSEKSVTRL